MNMAVRAKILLQHRKTLHYMTAEGQWTSEVANAAVFEHVADAGKFARQRPADAVDILMNFGDSQYDVRLPASADN